jgi:hypothetical protein
VAKELYKETSSAATLEIKILEINKEKMLMCSKIDPAILSNHESISFTKDLDSIEFQRDSLG